MGFQEILLSGFMEADRSYDKIFRRSGFVAKLLFYPIALDLAQQRNEVIEAVNERSNQEGYCGEYDIFSMFGDEEEIDSQFKKYILHGEIPFMIRQKCRNYLSSQTPTSHDRNK